jgi:hypothetical protein
MRGWRMTDGWRMDVTIKMPRMSLTVQICSHALGSIPEQAPPDVDEMAEKYGAYPYTGVKRFGTNPGAAS